MPLNYGTIKTRAKKLVGIEEDAPPSISVSEYFSENKRDFLPAIKDYILSLFPFLVWMPRYNLTWLYSDLIAGVTVGMVLVPQSLSYAKLANLPPEYGLYSSFIGVMTYSLFATAKDVSIGPVAVMSLVTGSIVTEVQKNHPDKYTAPEIATCVAFICGFIVLAIGLLRIGWIIEFIPQPAVAGFMTGSALNIAAGQVPALLGLSKLFDTRESTYKVIINTLKFLPRAKLDAAYGVSALALLYFIKWSLDYVQKRSPKWRRVAFFAQTLRHALVIILFTIIAWRTNVHRAKPQVALVGHVPSGLRHVGQPRITTELIGALGPHLPVATIVLLLEHISISKSFGRLNGYKINPNQELIAIGVNNTVGSVFQAYPSTGSFSRSALKSKCGVRTPAAGIPTGLVVIIALYAVAPAFSWIPNATLSALIIHAVADLVASPKQSFSFWRISPLEYLIFVGAVIWSVFYTIESGIYWSLCASVVLLLFRIARPKGHFLGKVTIRPEHGDPEEMRDVYIPLCTGHNASGGVTTRDLPVASPPPGIIIYRFEESFLYPNASFINDRLVSYAKQHTRRGKDFSTVKAGDRPWNDPGPRKGEVQDNPEYDKSKPILRAVVLDFSAVANIDTTGVQNLVDARKEVEKWADRHVEFHFCGLLSPWIRRALIAGGFGRGHRKGSAHTLEIAPAVRSYNVGGDADPTHSRPIPDGAAGPSRSVSSDEELDTDGSGDEQEAKTKIETDAGAVQQLPAAAHEGRLSSTSLTLLDRATPCFHFDIEDALYSIHIADVEASRLSRLSRLARERGEQ